MAADMQKNRQINASLDENYGPSKNDKLLHRASQDACQSGFATQIEIRAPKQSHKDKSNRDHNAMLLRYLVLTPEKIPGSIPESQLELAKSTRRNMQAVHIDPQLPEESHPFQNTASLVSEPHLEEVSLVCSDHDGNRLSCSKANAAIQSIAITENVEVQSRDLNKYVQKHQLFGGLKYIPRCYVRISDSQQILLAQEDSWFQLICDPRSSHANTHAKIPPKLCENLIALSGRGPASTSPPGSGYSNEGSRTRENCALEHGNMLDSVTMCRILDEHESSFNRQVGENAFFAPDDIPLHSKSHRGLAFAMRSNILGEEDLEQEENIEEEHIEEERAVEDKDNVEKEQDVEGNNLTYSGQCSPEISSRLGSKIPGGSSVEITVQPTTILSESTTGPMPNLPENPSFVGAQRSSLGFGQSGVKQPVLTPHSSPCELEEMELLVPYAVGESASELVIEQSGATTLSDKLPTTAGQLLKPVQVERTPYSNLKGTRRVSLDSNSREKHETTKKSPDHDPLSDPVIPATFDDETTHGSYQHSVNICLPKAIQRDCCELLEHLSQNENTPEDLDRGSVEHSVPTRHQIYPEHASSSQGRPNARQDYSLEDLPWSSNIPVEMTNKMATPSRFSQSPLQTQSINLSQSDSKASPITLWPNSEYNLRDTGRTICSTKRGLDRMDSSSKEGNKKSRRRISAFCVVENTELETKNTREIAIACRHSFNSLTSAKEAVSGPKKTVDTSDVYITLPLELVDAKSQSCHDHIPASPCAPRDTESISPKHHEDSSPVEFDTQRQTNNGHYSLHQTVYHRYTSSYPSYTGSRRDFTWALVYIEWLLKYQKALEPVLWDDFVRILASDFAQYVGLNKGELTGVAFYKMFIHKPLFCEKILSLENLQQALSNLDTREVTEIRIKFEPEMEYSDSETKSQANQNIVYKNEGMDECVMTRAHSLNDRTSSPEFESCRTSYLAKPYFETPSQVQTTAPKRTILADVQNRSGEERARKLPWLTTTSPETCIQAAGPRTNICQGEKRPANQSPTANSDIDLTTTQEQPISPILGNLDSGHTNVSKLNKSLQLNSSLFPASKNSFKIASRVTLQKLSSTIEVVDQVKKVECWRHESAVAQPDIILNSRRSFSNSKLFRQQEPTSRKLSDCLSSTSLAEHRRYILYLKNRRMSGGLLPKHSNRSSASSFCTTPKETDFQSLS